MFPHLVAVKALSQFKLQLRYDDGTEGVADISHLAGRGVFKIWNEDDTFFKVSIDPETNALVWSHTVDLDPDSLYLQLKGLTFEQFKAVSKPQVAYAAD
ncbi:MAG: DUF2442 domain-containing protein [Saprospiraceae bacterium]